MSALFGYTNPNIFNRHQQETPSDGTSIYNGSWVNRMDNFKETKDKFGEYPKINKTVIPNEFNDFTINSITPNFHPMARLNNSFYNGLATDEKNYLYGQEKYIPPSYPKHYINTNKFSPFYLAEINKKDNNEML